MSNSAGHHSEIEAREMRLARRVKPEDKGPGPNRRGRYDQKHPAGYHIGGIHSRDVRDCKIYDAHDMQQNGD